jgi:hypothetical protein
MKVIVERNVRFVEFDGHIAMLHKNAPEGIYAASQLTSVSVQPKKMLGVKRTLIGQTV